MLNNLLKSPLNINSFVLDSQSADRDKLEKEL